jgi:inner membrane protein
MPTIFTHPAVALAAAPWFRRIPRSLLILGVVCSALPDIDTASFAFGIPYEHPLGHRGVTHSLVFALLLAVCAAAAYRRYSRDAVTFRVACLFLFIVIASHGILDAMTNGGKGIGFFIPFSSHRFFFPFRPIEVSPIGASGFADEAGPVLLSEARWVWLPGLFICGAGFVWQRVRRVRAPLQSSDAKDHSLPLVQ